MDWIGVLKIAGGITTVLGLGAFAIALFVWLSAQRRERSLLQTVAAGGYDPKDIASILANFKDDQSRLQAFEHLLSKEESENKAILRKLKSDIDPVLVSTASARNDNRRIAIVGTVLLLIAAATFVAQSRIGPATPAVPDSSGTDVKTYQDAMQQLERNADSMSESGRNAAVAALKKNILSLGGPVDRTTRRYLNAATIDAIKALRHGDIALDFQHNEFTGADLSYVSFAGSRLAGVPFERSFLLEADFSNADLADARFVGAWLRNANFSGASLGLSEFRDSDWFNARGLAQARIVGIREGAWMPCPHTVSGSDPFSAYKTFVDGQYAVKFGTLGLDGDLIQRWRNLTAANGLCERVRQSSPR